MSSSSNVSRTGNSRPALTTSQSGLERHLPNWIFDIVDEDVVDMQTPLLQELDIDIRHILSNIIWTISSPVFLLCNCRKYVYKKYPRPDAYIKKSTSNDKELIPLELTSDQLIKFTADKEDIILLFDFWGPCLVMSVYGAVLWLAKVNHVALLYLIWLFAAIGCHLICRVFCQYSTLSMHLSLLGYSLAPIILCSGIIVLLKHLRIHNWLLIAILLELFSIFYATISTITSYFIIINPKTLESLKESSIAIQQKNIKSNSSCSSSKNIDKSTNSSPTKSISNSTNNQSTMNISTSTNNSTSSNSNVSINLTSNFDNSSNSCQSHDNKSKTLNNSTVSNNNNNNSNIKQRRHNRIYLLIPVVLLMHLYLIALIPM